MRRICGRRSWELASPWCQNFITYNLLSICLRLHASSRSTQSVFSITSRLTVFIRWSSSHLLTSLFHQFCLDNLVSFCYLQRWRFSCCCWLDASDLQVKIYLILLYFGQVSANYSSGTELLGSGDYLSVTLKFTCDPFEWTTRALQIFPLLLLVLWWHKHESLVSTWLGLVDQSNLEDRDKLHPSFSVYKMLFRIYDDRTNSCRMKFLDDMVGMEAIS